MSGKPFRADKDFGMSIIGHGLDNLLGNHNIVDREYLVSDGEDYSVAFGSIWRMGKSQ
jgi:hypothetical protein